MKTFLNARRSIPQSLWLLISGVLLACSGGIANAQTDEDESAAEEAAADDQPIEEIITTGSRVARDTFSSISPLQVIDGETSRDLGLVDTADLLRQTTVVQGNQITTGLSTSAGILTDNGPGSSTASLRGLDAGRTLVLVNGRRLAPAGVGGAPSVPDLNMVPGSLIDRVDVLLDGASSVYGSDAVAGVINVILRSDFDGLQLDAYKSYTGLTNGGGDRQVYSATWGVNDDRGFIGFAAEHAYIEGYKERDMAGFYSPYSGNCLNFVMQGASGELYEDCSVSFGAGAVSTGGLGFFGYDGVSNVAGFPPGFYNIPVTLDLLVEDNVNGQALLLWPEELDAAFAPDFKRTTLFSVGEFAPGWYGDATAYFEASWSSRQTTTNTSGQGRIRIPAGYAFGDFGGVDSTLYFGSFNLRDTEVAQTRITTGIKGDLPFMDGVGSFAGWTYDTYVSYSRSTGTDNITGIPFFPRVEQTLSNSRFDEDLGEYVCDPRTVPGEGQTINCRPLDFFDPTFLFTGRFQDPDDNAYLFPNRITNTIVEQAIFQGFVTGEMFDLPAGGPASLVLGVEYRDDRIRTDTDAGASAGDFYGFSGDPGSTGTRYLKEIFTEIDLPLLLDRRFAQELSLNVAARWTDEEFFGDETTYRVQGQYAPVDWFRVRATVGTSYRAPNLGEQFAGQVTGFGNPNDPCRVPGIAIPLTDHDNDPDTDPIRLYDPDLETRDDNVIQNCLNGGGPFGLQGTNPFELGTRGIGTPNTVFFGAPTLVASGSNPDLDAETSTAQTVGIVFEQPWTDRFDLSLSASYFEIEINDEVDQLSASTIVNRCYNSVGLVDQTCQFIIRDPRDDDDKTSGEISFVEALQQNLGTQVAEGIDYNLDFNIDFSAVNYNLVVRATHSKTQTEEEFRATEIFLDDDLTEFGNPEWRLNMTSVIEWRDWSFLWQTRYIDAMIEDIEDLDDQDGSTSGLYACNRAGDTPCLWYDDVDSYTVHDASAAWRGDRYVVRLGLTNVFDEPPPLTHNNSLFSSTSNGAGVGGVGYDLHGRTVFLNVTVGL